MILDDQAGRPVELPRRLLSDPDQQHVIDVLARERLVPDDVRRGLEHRARCAAVEEFERMLEGDLVEADWQRWFQENDWVLGSDFHGSSTNGLLNPRCSTNSECEILAIWESPPVTLDWPYRGGPSTRSGG